MSNKKTSHMMKCYTKLLWIGLASLTAGSAFAPSAFSSSIVEVDFLRQSFSSAHLPGDFLDPVDNSTRHPIAIGSIEAIDVNANQIVVAGQSVAMDDLRTDDFALGDYVWVEGVASLHGISSATVRKLATNYIHGSSLVFVEGFVHSTIPAIAQATVGSTRVDYSAALSRFPQAHDLVTTGTYVRAVGIRLQNGATVAADLQVLTPRPESTNDQPLKVSIPAMSGKIIIGGDRSAKAIIGGDRSAKAIIGGDRSAKAIIGGDRSAKAIIGGDRSAKAISGDDLRKGQ